MGQVIENLFNLADLSEKCSSNLGIVKYLNEMCIDSITSSNVGNGLDLNISLTRILFRLEKSPCESDCRL